MLKKNLKIVSTHPLHTLVTHPCYTSLLRNLEKLPSIQMPNFQIPSELKKLEIKVVAILNENHDFSKDHKHPFIVVVIEV